MEMRADIIRLETGAEGTFGVLRMDGRVFCVTLEPPDRDNRRNASCIPAGEYVCRRVESPRYGVTFEVTGVPGRSNILFHPGNVSGDTRGCVLLGNHFGLLRGDRGVLNSGRTFARFMDNLGQDASFTLSIDDRCGEGVWNTSA